MSAKTASPELIRRHAEELQGIRVDDARARELASEVSRINALVRASAAELGFDDEPLAFQARMRELAEHAVPDRTPDDPADES